MGSQAHQAFQNCPWLLSVHLPTSSYPWSMLNSMRCACPQNVTFAKMHREERLGSTKMKMEKKKKLGKFLQFLVVPESSLNVRLFLETPDDLLPPGTNVTHAGVNIAMWDQLDTVWLALGPPCPNAVGRHATVTVSHNVTWNLWLLLWNMTIKAPHGAFV